MTDYPEHEKLQDPAHGHIVAFLQWLEVGEESSAKLCVHRQYEPEDIPIEGDDMLERFASTMARGEAIRTAYAESGWHPLSTLEIGGIVAKYFDVDQDALEREKRDMLESLRRAS